MGEVVGMARARQGIGVVDPAVNPNKPPATYKIT
jgi:hypothetical protein